jgi:hypothetical protein
MAKTRLYIECPNCHTQYLVSEFVRYSNGAHIENVAGAPEWQRLLCPCQPDTPYKFKMSETMRLQVFAADENERTHFSPAKKKAPTAGPSKDNKGGDGKNT